MQRNFGDYLCRRARGYGQRAALIDEDGSTLTFEQVDDRSNRLGRRLQAEGLGAGDRVAVFLVNQMEFWEVSFGVTKAGMAIVYVNFRLTSSELSHQLSSSGATGLVVSEELLPIVEAADLSGVRSLIVLDDTYEEQLAARSADRLCVEVDENDTCILVFTSGTTGKPKGAMQTHANWFGYLASTLLAFDLQPDDSVLSAGPLVFSGRAFAYAAFYAGVPQHILRTFEPVKVLAAVERHRCTAVMLVPTMIYMLLEELERVDADTSSLRTIAYGGAPIAPEKLDRCLAHFGPVFVQVYGLSESPSVSSLAKSDHVPGSPRLASAGRPNIGMEIVVRNDDGREVSAGEVGELCVRGPIVMNGYFGDAEKTAERLVDGWLLTGDVGYVDEAGYAYIVDRRNDMIITGGSNVYPREVEDAISGHPAVAEVAVVGVRDDRWGEAVVAVVRLMEGKEATAHDLETRCRASLAGYKVPKSFIFADQPLPKSSHGKLLRREVRAELSAS